jgi:FixJ family two-component response regulator
MVGCDPTVFVVDDDPGARESLAALMSSLALPCETFASAEEFLARLDGSQSGCVVIDLRLGGMDGIQLLQCLTHRKDCLPAVVVSGFATVPLAVRAMLDGALTVLEKPCSEKELSEAICAALQLSGQRQSRRSLRDDVKSRFAQLAPREKEMLAMLVEGHANKTIAHKLGVSQRTAIRIRAAIYEKMGAESALDLGRFAALLKEP